MKDAYSEQEQSLSQLFDAIERRLDEMMMQTFRYSPAGCCRFRHSRILLMSPAVPEFRLMNRFERTTLSSCAFSHRSLAQIDEIMLKASGIWTKTRYLRNSFARINRFPRELLSHIPTFLQNEHDLINTTAVCRHWRTTLLSTPHLWCNISGSSAPKIRAYLQRSMWHPLSVRLTPSSSIRLLVPHIRRIVSLRLDLVGQSQMERIAEHLVEPAPSLRTLIIHSRHVGHTLDIPLSFLGASFPSLTSLFMEDISSFSGPHTFHSVTSLTLYTNINIPLDTASLLHALERLPSLETVLIKFRAQGIPTSVAGDRIITLPNLRGMTLFSTEDALMGPILPGLRLPKLEKLEVHSGSTLKSNGACFPLSFSKLLPNFSELPTAIIIPRSRRCEIHLQSDRQHVLGIFIGRLSGFEETSELLGGLPLLSVRSLTVEFPEDSDREWLFGMLGVMDGVEDLKISGGWTQVLQFWRGDREQNRFCPALRVLTVHDEEGAELDPAAFEDARRTVGLPLTTTRSLRGA
jgi:hypothetical protein